ncbi:MAG: GIY-YIG nuclease family protein [Terriglobales bacterium]|jgi:putative endonuclease
MHSSDRRYFYVYILTNRSQSLYVGVTNNLRRRVWEHKFGNGSEFCKRYKIDRLVYYESFDDVRNAIDREKCIKGWLRIKKVQLIVSVNPTWIDLSDEWYERHLYQPDKCMGLSPLHPIAPKAGAMGTPVRSG